MDKKRKSQKNKRKQITITTAIIRDAKGRILLTKRHDPKNANWHNKWQLPGGGIEFGEDPQDTIKREIKEEVNIEIEITDKNPIVHSHVFEKQNLHILLLNFKSKYISGALDITRDKETSDVKWCYYEEIDFSACLPQVKNIIDKARGKAIKLKSRLNILLVK